VTGTHGQVLLARVVRSGFVESVHAGHAVIVDPDGAVQRSWGRPEDPMLPRSSNKPLQAVGMVEAGLDLAGPQLAIAAATHNGEQQHLATVRAILADGGLSEADLENTPALPYSQPVEAAWLRAGGEPSSLTQNCSGKHAAMLRTALVLHAPTRGYPAPEHPVQRAASAGIEQLSGERIVATGVDGCGAPVSAISLIGLARAFSRLGQSAPASAAGRVARAMSAHPYYVAGADRDVTRFMVALPGAIAKDGTEGVHAFCLPDGRAAAVKLADGAERARAAVVVALLAQMGVAEQVRQVCAPPPVLGGGAPVGAVEGVL
jgi:L-asparaginase II